MKRKEEHWTTKDIIIWVVSIILLTVGVGLTICGFICPPVGVIDGSVLIALGEFLTFFGSVAGIAEYTKVQIAKITRTE